MRIVLILLSLSTFFFIDLGSYERVVWHDEFDQDGSPDSSKWDYDLGDGCPQLCGWGNNELQTYTALSKNVRVENGKLIIEANKDDQLNYNSARLVTRGKSAWKYGRIEVSAKMPKGRGTWSAIWMLPVENKYGIWPKSGEIDIAEHVGFDHGKIHGTVHTEAFNHMIDTHKGKSIEITQVDEKFHTYAIEWDLEGISFFMDDKKYNYFSNTTQGYKEWPFDEPFYLVINLAVGGNWGGKHGVDDAIWPQRMEVDYVRVYQL